MENKTTKQTTWVCASPTHDCANRPEIGTWTVTEPFNDCIIIKPTENDDKYGSGMLMKCLHFDEDVLFRILKIE